MPGSGCSKHSRFTAGCADCRRISNHYCSRRTSKIKQGVWLYSTPAKPVMDHISRLRNAGMSIAAISRASNVPISTLYTLFEQPRRMMFGHTAAALLAVEPRPTPPAGMVYAVGTVRRLRALVMHGYSLTEIGRRLDCHLQQVAEWARGRQQTVSVGTEAAVIKLYNSLSQQPGTSTRARNFGRRNGWHPQGAWDDDTIDDPNAMPYCGADIDNSVDDVLVDEVLHGHRRFADLNTAEQAALWQAWTRYRFEHGYTGPGVTEFSLQHGLTVSQTTTLRNRAQADAAKTSTAAGSRTIERTAA